MTPLDPKKARLTLGLTQSHMGRLLGYSGEHVRQQVYDIECGDKPLMPCQRRLLQAYIDGYRPDDWPFSQGEKIKGTAPG